MKVLQLCHKMPFPPNDGGSIAIYNTAIGLMENNVEVNILAMNPSRDLIPFDSLPEEFVEKTKLRAVKVNTEIRPVQVLVNFFTRRSYFIERFDSVSFKQSLTDILRRNTYDIIQLEHLYMCLYIDTIRKNSKAKIILRPQNVEYEIWEGYIRNMHNGFKKRYFKITTRRLKKFEISVLSRVDGIIAVTPKDAAIFRMHVPQVPVVDVPVSFNYGRLNNYNFEMQYEKFPTVYHLGSMNWRPNEEAVNWFIESVLPDMVKQFPDIRIHLAGKKMPKKFMGKYNHHLVVEGTVPDSLNYQEEKAIMIVPLKTGSGIRAKIVEGMALGKTIISTSVGAMGIACTHDENILIADSPENFVEQLQSCIKSEKFCRRIGNKAREFAFKYFHHKTCAQNMVHFYKTIKKENLNLN